MHEPKIIGQNSLPNFLQTDVKQFRTNDVEEQETNSVSHVLFLTQTRVDSIDFPLMADELYYCRTNLYRNRRQVVVVFVYFVMESIFIGTPVGHLRIHRSNVTVLRTLDAFQY